MKPIELTWKEAITLPDWVRVRGSWNEWKQSNFEVMWFALGQFKLSWRRSGRRCYLHPEDYKLGTSKIGNYL